MKLSAISWIVLLIWMGTGCGIPKPESIVLAEKEIPAEVDFNFHVKPILSDRCYACHGPDQENREAGLRLDERAAAIGELPETPGKHAIRPGNLRNSELVHRILTEDPEQMMPPPESKLVLSETEKAILLRWVEQGAEYKPHWAFMPVEVEKVPKEVHPIDHFIRQQLQLSQLTPAPQANKETLIRRVSFDLTGLPPSLEEIDAFLADDSPDAYEKVVDRLLASSRYGERMTAHWLDVARYADSDGYLDDKHRDFSPWRDWVIRAFNENLPYDEFVTWQLAGDLLPNATQEQILATAFNRLHKKNSEAGIVFEEYRVEYTADRTNTFGKAFMGLSLECARCHDHKYDPISQKEYYQLFGFFNQTNEWGHAVYGPDQTPGPALLLADEATESQIRYLQSLERQQESALKEAAQTSDQAFRTWVASSPASLQSSIDQALVSHISFDRVLADGPEKAKTPDLAQLGKHARLTRPHLKPGVKGDAFFVTDDNSGAFPEKVGWYERTESFSLDLWVHPDTVYEQANLLTHCEDRRLGLKGYSLHLRNNRPVFIMAHSWPQNAIQIIADSALEVREWSHLTVTYDGSSTARGVKFYINGNQLTTVVEVDNLYKGILYEYDIHTYGFGGILFGVRNKLIPFKKGGLDEIKIYDRALTELEVLQLHLGKATESLLASAQEAPIVKSHFLQQVYPLSLQLQDSLAATRKQLNTLLNSVPEIMVMGDSTHTRPTYVLNRGSYEQRGEAVQAGVPKDVLAYPDSLPRNRLGLAKWLFDPQHPLSSRVMVNRMWQLHFGQGLVRTSEDFGSQGALPSHPELLDWLANWFVRHEWDLKALHKLIVLSETYQQSSVYRPELEEIDPENVLLARGPSFRLPAEMIRDNSLAISQLLVEKVGGKSVYPYQPAGLWDEISNKHWRYRYLQEPGEGLYRRSIYSIWKRTSPPPPMVIFDIADRDNCTVRRRMTNTPLQALVLLNDPQFQEAARVTAEQILLAEPNERSCLQQAFRLVTGRKAKDTELKKLQAFWEGERDYYQTHPEDALAYLGVGETAWDRSLEPAELASLGVTINSLMNTAEGVTRN